MNNKGAMAEYIDRGALLASKQLLALSDHDRAMAKAVILGQPTADVVEVRHGEWVHNKNDVVLNSFVCSICGNRESSLYPINAVIGGGYIADEHGNFFYPPKMNYCPNCGADMRGEKDG